MKHIKLFAGAAVLLLAAVLLASHLYGFTTPKIERLYLVPTYGDAAGWDIHCVEDGAERVLDLAGAQGYDGVVYLRRTIPADWVEQGYRQMLLFPERLYRVFVDGQLVYTNARGADSLPAVFPEYPSYDNPVLDSPSLGLSSQWAGKTLTIATIKPADTEQLGLGAILTSEDVEYAFAAAITAGQLIPAVFFGMLGILLLAVFGYGLLHTNADGGLLILAAAALTQMLLYLGTVGYGPVFYGPLLFQPLFLLLPMLYTALQMKQHRRTFLWLLVSCWGVYAAVLVLSRTLLPTMPIWAQNLAPYFICLPMLGLLFFGRKERRTGNAFFRGLLPWVYIGLGALLGLFLLYAVLPFHSNGVTNGFTILLRMMNLYFVNAVTAAKPVPLLYFMNTMLLFALFIITVLRQVESSLKAAEDVRVLELRNDLVMENLQIVEQSSQALAVHQHDELHHLRTLSQLCREAAPEAAAYADSVVSELATVPPLCFTENTLVNAILTVQAGKARALGVDFHAEAILPPVLSIPDKDVCAVLMNLMENAVEAAAWSGEEAGRRVRVGLSIEDGFLQITIENTLPEDFELEAFRVSQKSTKRDGAAHGLGMKSVRVILSRYEGELRYSLRDGALLLQTVMRMGE